MSSGGHVVEHQSVKLRGRDGGSMPPGNFVHHICVCLLEDTLKAGGPFYLVSMPWEVKRSHTRGKYATGSGLTNSRGQL